MKPSRKHFLALILVIIAVGATSFAVRTCLRDARQHRLCEAAAAGDLATVSECLAFGADVNRGGSMPDSSIGLPPLTIAAGQGHTAIVRHLLAHGADPNLRGQSNPLILACWHRHYESAKALLEHGADPNARGEGTPLIAAEYQPELVTLLGEYGAK